MLLVATSSIVRLSERRAVQSAMRMLFDSPRSHSRSGSQTRAPVGHRTLDRGGIFSACTTPVNLDALPARTRYLLLAPTRLEGFMLETRKWALFDIADLHPHREKLEDADPLHSIYLDKILFASLNEESACVAPIAVSTTPDRDPQESSAKVMPKNLRGNAPDEAHPSLAAARPGLFSGGRSCTRLPGFVKPPTLAGRHSDDGQLLYLLLRGAEALLDVAGPYHPMGRRPADAFQAASLAGGEEQERPELATA
ncbi:hypothetical protein N657DRAFT_637423 [Parathielavia appendiculata]|uniref:Uncharacterized protein n=1 Tax=Parathielavia appendiculata TaxID=2587402 RepID=A0AAN6Z096_9PEZI|nr:hypothetical protein N657DRAFT_637423 [Parathielavia appendiculata]